MPVQDIDDVERLKKINAALIRRVEQSMDQQGSAFTLFQTAINLESRVRARTEELHNALRHLEHSNLELVRAKEQAEEANLSKTRFLAAASHDVLQPLNAAHLSISALADMQNTLEGEKLVRQVERSLETMDTLLRTLLDISRLDAGVVRLDMGDVALDHFFQSIRSDFEPIARNKGLRLRFAKTAAVLRTDRTLLLRILQNLVSNAIRYTRTGGVLVGMRRRGESWRIDVADTGIGVPEHEREAIFEEFHRGVADNESGLGGAGLGLGLAIVRRMADRLGYRISLDSRRGGGTIFHIDLPPAARVTSPLHEATGAAPPSARGYGLFGAKILVIENDPNVLDAMAALLAGWGCSVRVASSSLAAIAEVNDTDWIPDVIVADQHLDDDDLGSLTIEAIRDHVGRRVPAVLATADTGEIVARLARDLNAEVMHKPIKPAQLRALLAHILA